MVPSALADELYDKLADYYRDDPNVSVIVDRRGHGGKPGSYDAQTERRRRRAKGSFPPIAPPSSA
ncbi:MAG TPA: hypothetical protein VEQ61_03565 [Thermoleophilaceae bacterium]|nr:hypothetical protein [Thermoleophilaceae bacterium]